jgi:hypothetical protein
LARFSVDATMVCGTGVGEMGVDCAHELVAAAAARTATREMIVRFTTHPPRELRGAERCD